MPAVEERPVKERIAMTIIEVQDLSKHHGANASVQNVSCSVEAREIFGVLGRHGAGQPANAECVAGLRGSAAGTVRELGLDPRYDRAA